MMSSTKQTMLNMRCASVPRLESSYIPDSDVQQKVSRKQDLRR